MVAANDKIKITSDIGAHVQEPVVEVKYKDKTVERIIATNLSVEQLDERILKHVRNQ